ncbi:MAG: Serine-type D-Ala-D-Ala carboxypeptidase [Parcubacteria group bacterium GW2011_GWA2_47_12]|nr:MAG: Serine-type D-Ala-D-Ala carboxypeptidase [Parcubacteria group bacterium GW2011_GWA2_47_12]
MNKPNTFFRFFISFAFTGALVGALSYIPRAAETLARADALAQTASVSAAVNQAASPFAKVELGARAAFVFDISTGKTLFDKNASAQLPLASLTKLMTSVMALALVPNYALVTVTPESLKTEGDSGLRSNEQWSIKDLLSFSLTASSNDGVSAAAAIAGSFVSNGETDEENKAEFIEAMNAEAQRAGLSATYFLNETGLDENAEISGGYGSARDAARLIAYAYRAHPELFGATTQSESVFTEENGNRHEADNTNKIVAEIPMLRASKTGFTDLAGGNLAVVFDAGIGKPIAVSVLGSTKDGRFEDVKNLVDATLQFLQRNDL